MGLFSAKPSVNAQKIIGWLGCECEYFPAGKPAQFISSTYEDAFAKKEMGGYTPIIIVVNDVLSEWFDMLREESGTSPDFPIPKPTMPLPSPTTTSAPSFCAGS